MRIPKAVVQERVGQFLEVCRARGIKITHQRMEIYREMACTGEHPDAMAIYARLRKRMPTISLDTVYRNLRIMEKEGFLSIVGMSHERLRFDANLEPHHHFTCEICGKMRDFQITHTMPPEWKEAVRQFGHPVSLYLEVRGVCAECGKTNSARCE